MATPPHLSCIGIDGGGTSCRFALLRNGQRVAVTGGAANASTDLDAARATLVQGLADLAQAAHLPAEALRDVPTFMGLAGVLDTDMADQVRAGLPLAHVQVEDDRRTAMVGALGAQDGCVIGIGTGSFFGRRAGGHDRVIGGWGLVLGDEASGAYLGRALLQRVLHTQDKTRAPSPLTQDIFARFGSPRAIVSFAATASPADFAALAPDIVEAATKGDPTAVALMMQGARHIEHMLTHLGWQTGEVICPLGGLAPHYAPYLTAPFAPPKGTALDGALELATQMAAQMAGPP